MVVRAYFRSSETGTSAECVGSQMLMMNAFEPLLKRAGLATEHIKALFDQVQKTKLIQAQELLAKRRAEEARRAIEIDSRRFPRCVT
jgi:hypothetical protein